MGVMRTTDEFGARMKAYEAIETHRRLDQSLPIYARIDGRSFSRFTKGMERPFDPRMTQAMIGTTMRLVEATNARMGYTQSDEISLVWLTSSTESQGFFAGKIQKMVSILAALTTAAFHREVDRHFVGEAPRLLAKLPHFDARVFNLPNTDEAANAILWRAMDARKNAISMVAQANYSHKSLQGVDQAGMLARMQEGGIDFEAYPESFRRGTFIQRQFGMRELTAEELAAIPEKYRPSGPVERSLVRSVLMPAFNMVENRVGVVFDGEAPRILMRCL